MTQRIGRKGGQIGNDNASKTHIDQYNDYNDYYGKGHGRYNEMRADAHKDLSYDSGNALIAWSEDRYLPINKFLRTGKVDAVQRVFHNDAEKKIQSWITGIKNSAKPLPEDLILYRRTTHEPKGTFVDKGFTSTSLMAGEGTAFGTAGGPHISRIRVKKGTLVAYGVFDQSYAGKTRDPEHEILLMPGAKFKVLPKHRGSIYHELEHVSSD